jgi:hypothetical protein
MEEGEKMKEGRREGRDGHPILPGCESNYF